MSGENLVVTPGGRGVLLASSGEKPEMLLNILHVPDASSPPTKTNPTHSGNSWDTLIQIL